MTINRSALKRNSASSLLEKVKKAVEESQTRSYSDEREWKPTVDAAGNGYAVIRFLPAKTEDGLPFVKTYSHGFQEGAKYYIEECPTTIGKECPVCEANGELWNSGIESNKDIARKRKRRLRYISNILVVKDPKNPENEGKVFLYSYGKKIFDKLLAVMNPPEEYGEEPRDPFGFFEGCELKMKIKQVGGFRNYDDSLVVPAPDLFDGDEEKLLKLLDEMYDLSEFTDPKRFKSYDELKARFDMVIGAARKTEETSVDHISSGTGTEYGARKTKEGDDEELPWSSDDDEEKSSDEDTPTTLDEDDDMAYFKKLMEDD